MSMALDSMIADFLRHHPVVRALTESQLNRLYELIELEILGADATIVEQESLSRDLYIPSRGRSFSIAVGYRKTAPAFR